MATLTLSEMALDIGTGSRAIFGVGAVARLADAVRELDGARAFLVTDRGLAASGLSDTVARQLAEAGLEVRVYADLEPNPTGEDIAAGGAGLRAFGQAVVVGLGGGTALDAAKGISLAAVNEVPVKELDYRNQPRHPGLPVVAVPTTAGTGSETNSFAVIEDPEAHRKFYIGHASVLPRAAILDPALTTGLPAGPTAATGMDALTHALESLMAQSPNPFAHGIDLQVARMVHRWLPVVVETGTDLEGRSQMLLAAHMAGLAFATTGLGLCHALGHTLSALLGTAHGVALSVLLPSVMRFNLPARTRELAEVGVALGLAPTGATQEAAAQAAVEGVRALARSVGMPATLGGIGLTKAMVPRLVRGALEDIVLANNPIQPSSADLEALLAPLVE